MGKVNLALVVAYKCEGKRTGCGCTGFCI